MEHKIVYSAIFEKYIPLRRVESIHVSRSDTNTTISFRAVLILSGSSNSISLEHPNQRNAKRGYPQQQKEARRQAIEDMHAIAMDLGIGTGTEDYL